MDGGERGQTSGPLNAAQHGAFTYFALGALRGCADGGLDGERDGSVTMDEAQTYVQRTLKTAQFTSQAPEVNGARDLVLSVRAKEAAPVTIGGVSEAVGIGEVEKARDAIAKAGGAGGDFVSPTLGTMKWIPAGTFLMGSPAHADETPHRVTLTKGYWLMEHEVTQGEYTAVMGKNPAKFAACGATCPVERVSWDDAVAFATAVSRRDGVSYRLPTEAEWERAARGGSGEELYAGGNDLGAVGWYGDNAGSTTHRVCQKRRNGSGLCDMSGNVWEWVADWYGPYPGTVEDPAGARSGSYRVIRGGCWVTNASVAVEGRLNSYPTGATYGIGFRLARSSP